MRDVCWFLPTMIITLFRLTKIQEMATENQPVLSRFAMKNTRNELAENSVQNFNLIPAK